MHVVDLRVRSPKRHLQRLRQRADRADAFACRNEALIAHVHFDGGLGLGVLRQRPGVLAVVYDDTEAFQREMGARQAQMPLDEQRQRPVGDLVGISLGFACLHVVENGLHLVRLTEVVTERRGFGHERRLAS